MYCISRLQGKKANPNGKRGRENAVKAIEDGDQASLKEALDGGLRVKSKEARKQTAGKSRSKERRGVPNRKSRKARKKAIRNKGKSKAGGKSKGKSKAGGKSKGKSKAGSKSKGKSKASGRAAMTDSPAFQAGLALIQ